MASSHELLASQRAKVAELETQLERERLMLTGMEAMAEAMGGQSKAARAAKVHSPVQTSRPSGSFGGRQPGAITQEWRSVLADLVGGPFSVNAVVATVKAKTKRDMRPFDANRRMQQFIGFGYVEAVGSDYRVTERAVTKFGLMKKPEITSPQQPAPAAPAAPTSAPPDDTEWRSSWDYIDDTREPPDVDGPTEGAELDMDDEMPF